MLPLQGLSDKTKKYLRWFWGLVLSPFIILFLLIISVSFGWLGELPDTAELENPKYFLATEIYATDGQVLGKFYAENRSPATYQDLDSNLINALIATEDARFREHSGIDFRGLVRVFGRTIIGGDQSGGGGSTISQQLAKMLFPREKISSKLSLSVRKIKEWVIATRLEKKYTKDEILAMYLNKFDFLNLAVGIRSAAKIYFNTTPDSLRIEQAAMLVGMAKNPSLFNPIRKPDTTLHRRNVVMMQMVKYGFLTREKYDSLKVLPLGLNFKPEDHNEGLAPYFREYLRTHFLSEWLKTTVNPETGKPYDVYRDGLKIYTTLDSRMQQYAENAVKNHMAKTQEKFFKDVQRKKNAPFAYYVQKTEIEKILTRAKKDSYRYKKLKGEGKSDVEIEREFNTPDTMTVFTWQGEKDTIMTPMDSIRYYKSFLQSGFMAMDPHTGFVKAWVGGINHKHFKYDHVKVAARQVGSTFKPCVNLLAIMNGVSPWDRVTNQPVTIIYDNKDWTPRNSSHKSLDGKVLTLKYALAQSINFITAHIMKQYNPEAVITLARRMGITAPMDPYPSICLGTPDISVYEMVGAYSTFANKGTWIEPTFITRIEDKNGKLLYEYVPRRTEVMSEEKAYIMLELMKGATLYGTGASLRGGDYRFTAPIAGKTGTTQHNADGWFMGITPDLVAGAWVGAEDRSVHFSSMEEGQGSRLALPIWGQFMKQVWNDKKLSISQGDFEKPAKPISVELDCSKYDKEVENIPDFEKSGDFDKNRFEF